MSYCPNPRCSDRINTDTTTHCHHCHTPLLLKKRYRLIRPLREINEWEPIEVFEIEDIEANAETAASTNSNNPILKVLKLMKNKHFQPSFEREATTLQRLNHKGIPQVAPDGYFSCEITGREVYCLIMEKIEGTSLEKWLQSHGPIDQATALDWLTQLTDILAQVHHQELFHRDIKLPNIMLRSTGQLVLIDFGAVRPITNTYLAKVGGGGLREVTSVVSPGYTPIEQVSGRAVPQSDFYSLGRSLVHLLTGQHPIDLREDATTGRLEWRNQLYYPLDDWLMDLLDNMIAPFPGQRPVNADILKKHLTQPPFLAQPSLPIGSEQSSFTAFSSTNTHTTSSIDWLAAVNVAIFLLQLWLGWRWWSVHQAPSSQDTFIIQPVVYIPFIDISVASIEAASIEAATNSPDTIEMHET